jgi:LuxR family transcriptional regulator
MLVTTEECRTPREVIAVLEKLLAEYGFRYYAVLRHIRPDSDGDFSFMAKRLPDGWMKSYAEARHYIVDPAYRYLSVAQRPFRWRQALRAYSEDPNVRHMERVMNEAGTYGLRDGYIFPIHGKGGLLSFVSIGGNPVDLSPTGMSLFQAGAKAAYWKLRTFEEEEGIQPPSNIANPVMTKREIEVLVHLADGLTSIEIGRILSISRHTVDWYMSVIQTKLGARNRQHAVAIAFRNGMIA